MAIYPPEILIACRTACTIRANSSENAVGRAASFACGCFAAFTLSINAAKRVEDGAFASNGCGYMVAASEQLIQKLRGRDLRELHGLDSQELADLVEKAVGDFPADRRQCCEIAIEALQNAFADFRSRQVEEFSGDKALICTCFGVSQDTIETFVGEHAHATVHDVTNACRAGGGCGSCRMLIEEIIDSRNIP